MDISFGNTKLDKNIAIFNMNAAMDCPSDELGLCPHSEICYAKKAERMYKAVLPYRRRQEEYWDSHTADEFVEDILEKGTYKAGKNKGKLKFDTLRVSEAGDFKGQNDVDKLDAIATSLKEHGVKTYTYTARSDLVFDDVKDLTVNGSEFMVHNQFSAVDKYPSDKPIHCAGSCGDCTLCVEPRGADIQVLKH